MTAIFPSALYSAKTPISVDNFSVSLGDDSTTARGALAVLPPMFLTGVFRENGLFVVTTLTDNDPDIGVVLSFRDLSTGVEVFSLEVTISSVVYANLLAYRCLVGVSQLQSSRRGCLFWYPTDAADPPNSSISVFLEADVTTTGGNRRNIQSINSIQTDGWIMDATPFSRVGDIYFAYCFGKTVAGEPHIVVKKVVPKITGWPESPTVDTLIPFTDAWELELTPAFWADRPDTMLQIQCVPNVIGKTDYLIGLIGNFEGTIPPGIAVGVTNPRLVLMTLGGVPKWSHETGEGIAYGMCLDQEHNVYVTGTQDIMNGGDFLICKYSTADFGRVLARVAHGSNGLGAYADDPIDTKVLTPIWTGSNLVVQDHGPSSTTVYVYDSELNFINSYVLSSSSPSSGPRWRASRYGVTWVGESY